MLSKNFILIALFILFGSLFVSALFIIFSTRIVYAQGQEVASIEKSVEENKSLTIQDMEEAVKDLLRQNVRFATQKLGQKDGFYGNRAVRLTLPKYMERIEYTVRDLGDGELVDVFLLHCNLAAEKSIPKVAGYFMLAVEQLHIKDSAGIIRSEDNTAATLYFHRYMSEVLIEFVRPIIHDIIEEQGGAVDAYKMMLMRYRQVPFVPAVEFSVEDFVIENVLEAFFVTMSDGEKRLRVDPKLCEQESLRRILNETTISQEL
ncbi:MAG: DUF4197 domain-containing protein [Alphaproteobacteria bacterium]|nr:DUF4197 domain-containing protein [Alphaproteobacteria bacterium]